MKYSQTNTAMTGNINQWKGNSMYFVKQLEEDDHHRGRGVPCSGGDHFSFRQIFYSTQANQATG